MKKETENFVNGVYHGSIGLLLNGFVEKQKLSLEEIARLTQIPMQKLSAIPRKEHQNHMQC